VSEIDTAPLVELASKQKTSSPVKVAWAPLDLGTLHDGTYLAADPSLTGFGLVLFEVDQARRRYCVHLAAKFDVPKTEAGGWEDILTRAATLNYRLDIWLRQYVFVRRYTNLVAVHEAPPIGHGKMLNPEISLIASREFRASVRHVVPILPMVRRQDHCKLICGNANAKKPEHHAALRGLFSRIPGSEDVTNEATRDALSVALTAAKRGF
jgi:hypothetical protein